jgi:hypothetical protein
MTTKFKTVITAITLTLLTQACATTGMMSGTGKGWLYTDIREHAMVTANQAGKKRGQACANNILGLISTGDASLARAMRDGSITVVSSVDVEDTGLLFLWGKHCTIVTGN